VSKVHLLIQQTHTISLVNDILKTGLYCKNRFCYQLFFQYWFKTETKQRWLH